MNNKGFAITTVIYGLSILGILLIVIIMGNYSTNRANTRQLSRDVDNELNFYSRSSLSYAFTVENDLQQFEVPVGQSGWYRIELWGASGNGVNGGKGAYTTGIIKLTEGDLLYFKIGGSSDGKVGGSTDVRIIDDNGKIGLMSRIMVAGGGGIEPGSDGGTLCGYSIDMAGRGGAIKDDYQLDTAKTSNYFGTQFASGAPKSLNECVVGSVNGSFKNDDSDPSTSGDGYYISNATGANRYGGSSYISGYAGVTPITNKLAPAGITPDTNSRITSINGYSVSTDGTITSDGDFYNSYIFKDGLMIPGVKSGNGAAHIEKLSIGSEKSTSKDDSLKINEYFYNINYVIDCSENAISGMELIRDGHSIPLTMTSMADQDGLHCVKYTNTDSTTKDYYYDELVLWHKPWSNTKREKLTINYYTKDGHTNRDKIIDLTDSGTEVLDGTRISAYQPDLYCTSCNLDLDGGNYYIFSILSENKVVSAPQNKDMDFDPIRLDPIIGESRQKWSITGIPDKIKEDPSVTNEYSIVELSRYGALAIELDENIAKNKVIAYSKFNSLARNTPQIWRLYPLGNGTFYINTPVTYFDSNTGSLLATPSKENSFADHANELIIVGENVPTARFKFYKLDY